MKRAESAALQLYILRVLEARANHENTENWLEVAGRFDSTEDGVTQRAARLRREVKRDGLEVVRKRYAGELARPSAWVMDTARGVS